MKPARWPIDAPGRVLGEIEPREDLDQADRIDVPDAGPGRVVADPRRIAGQRDDVADPQCVGAEQLRLERHQVPVPRRAVDEALEVEVVLDPERDGQRAHPDLGHRRVGDVDDVDAGVTQESRGLDRPLDADAPRRVDLDRHDEPSAGEQLGQPRRRRGIVGAPSSALDQRRSARRADSEGRVLARAFVGAWRRSARTRRARPASRRCARASSRSSRRRSAPRPRRSRGVTVPEVVRRRRRRRIGPRAAATTRRSA